MKSFTLKENYIIFEVFKIFRYKEIDKQTADRQTDILFILSNIFFFFFRSWLHKELNRGNIVKRLITHTFNIRGGRHIK